LRRRVKMSKKINVAIIGLGFGKEFIPIYQAYPGVEVYAICRRNKEELQKVGEKFGITNLYTDWRDLLDIKEIDAIHIVSPILDHAEMTVESLKAGKHCACTVPMATTVQECKDIVEAKNESSKVYMMMETAVYTREFLYVKKLVDSGKLGRIQFVRGSHMQDMGLEGWPEYWLGFPPMWYGTHAISPLLALAGTEAESVVCHGSGSLSDDLASKYGSPFAVETATFKLRDSNIIAEATRSLYETVRQYRESLDIYGDKLSFEWEQIQDENHALFEGGEDARRIMVPDTDEMLPEEVKKFTLRESIEDNKHVSFIQGAGHGGSHPHMVHEFITAIRENRDSAVDAATAANWTSAGVCAHESAIKGGERILIPDYKDLKE
jgi:predicted dehydrogenase